MNTEEEPKNCTWTKVLTVLTLGGVALGAVAVIYSLTNNSGLSALTKKVDALTRLADLRELADLELANSCVELID